MEIFSPNFQKLRKEGCKVVNPTIASNLNNDIHVGIPTADGELRCPLVKNEKNVGFLKLTLGNPNNTIDEDILSAKHSGKVDLHNNDFVLSFVECPDCPYGQYELCKNCLLSQAGLQMAKKGFDINGIASTLPPAGR